MSGPKPREQRQAIALQARLRNAGGWTDATICNVSPRGLMLKCIDPPLRGAFVEVRRNDCSVVGLVRWSAGGRFGLRSQDVIDLVALSQDLGARPNGANRRGHKRDLDAPRDPRQLAARELRSHLFAHYANWLIIAMAGMLAAAVVVETAASVFGSATQQARVGMGSPG